MQTVSRLQPGGHRLETLLPSCSQPPLLSVFRSIWGQWGWGHDSHVTASSLLGFSVMRPRSRAEGAAGTKVGAVSRVHTCVGNQIQQALTLERSHSIHSHLISKYWLWEWHLLLSHQRKHCSKHHKKKKSHAPFEDVCVCSRQWPS